MFVFQADYLSVSLCGWLDVLSNLFLFYLVKWLESRFTSSIIIKVSFIYLYVCMGHKFIILHCIMLSDCSEISFLYLIKMHMENYVISLSSKISDFYKSIMCTVLRKIQCSTVFVFVKEFFAFLGIGVLVGLWVRQQFGHL